MDIVHNPVYLGIIIGIAVLNAALLAACVLTLRRRALHHRNQRKRISSPIAWEMYERSPAFAAFTEKNPRTNEAQGAKLSYFQLIHSLQEQPSSLPNRPSGPNEVKNGIRFSQVVLPPQSVKVPNVTARRTSMMQHHAAQSQLTVPDMQQPVSALRRVKSLDAETASLYSCKSAPLEFHEHLFRTRPLILSPTTPMSAPVWYNPRPLSVLSEAKLDTDVSRAPVSFSSRLHALRGLERSQYPIVENSDDVPTIPSTIPSNYVQVPPPARTRVSSDPPRSYPNPQISHLRSHSVVDFRPVAPLNVRRVNRIPSGSTPQPLGSPVVPSLDRRAPELPARSAKRPAPSSLQTPTPQIAEADEL